MFQMYASQRVTSIKVGGTVYERSKKVTRVRETFRFSGRWIDRPLNRLLQLIEWLHNRKISKIFTLDHARSKRSRFITLFHAATKSFRNFCWPSEQA